MGSIHYVKAREGGVTALYQVVKPDKGSRVLNSYVIVQDFCQLILTAELDFKYLVSRIQLGQLLINLRGKQFPAVQDFTKQRNYDFFCYDGVGLQASEHSRQTSGVLAQLLPLYPVHS